MSVKTGERAKEVGHRLPNKYQDGGSGYYYYSCWCYDSQTARWLNRDHIAEKCGFKASV